MTELLHAAWRDFVASTPQAEHIHWLLTQRGELLCNDHIALRTFGAPGIGPGIGIDALARPFEALGWQARDDYRCRDTHVRARSWQHGDPGLPKLLISELVIEELSAAAQATIGRLVGQLPARFGDRADLAWAGRPWQVSLADYEALAAESAHAAWVAAFGFRVNHIAVDLTSLSSFPDLEALAAFLIEHGVKLSDGGVVKGSRACRLEQLSTRADPVTVAFADTEARIPSCEYGFARRYPLPDGELFQGFLLASAEPAFASDLRRAT